MKSSKKRYEFQDVAKVSGHQRLTPELIVRFVSYRWILLADNERELLDEEDIARARFILELQEIFGVNNESIPIILHLIDQLNRTHLEFKSRS
jgi:hypothetical protein